MNVQPRMHIVNFWKWCHGFCKYVKNNYFKCRLYAQKLECSMYYRSREVPRDNISFIYLHGAVVSKTQIRNYIKIVIFLLCTPKTNRQCKYVQRMIQFHWVHGPFFALSKIPKWNTKRRWLNASFKVMKSLQCFWK